ncbi:MAG: prepilin-type N-terminal cleavage/methylation domain-containing protein [Verrucomicrobia bacterium]|nr:prepilin-type N-terminal cleavage/methylation domain-containing protein [Verrucomicrobiota bacterium]
MSSSVPRSSSRSAFSLIELLVVIAIILILVGLVFVMIGKVQGMANRARAKSDIKQLEKAFVAYHDEYGDWPYPLIGYDNNGEDMETVHTGIQLGENAAHLLSGVNVDDLNPREIIFFDVPRNRIRRDNDNTVGFVDPWNYCYKYMMDFNDDGEVEARFTSGLSTNIVSGIGVAVWSQGPDGDDQFESDNITSWKSQ